MHFNCIKVVKFLSGTFWPQILENIQIPIHLSWFQVLLREKCYEGLTASHTVGKWVSHLLTLTSGPFGISQGAQTDPSNILHATVDMSAGRIMYLCWPGIPNTYQLFTHMHFRTYNNWTHQIPIRTGSIQQPHTPLRSSWEKWFLFYVHPETLF